MSTGVAKAYRLQVASVWSSGSSCSTSSAVPAVEVSRQVEMTRPLISTVEVAFQHGVTARRRIGLPAIVAGRDGSRSSVAPSSVVLDVHVPKTFERLRPGLSDCHPPGPTVTSYRQAPDGIDGATGVQISGGLTQATARQLAALLSAGPLAAPLEAGG